jgi:hypothetical protein
VLPSAYVVTTTADSGPGSLRDAINQVNADTSHTLYASPSNPNVDEIDFNITAASDAAGGGMGFDATTGLATITPQSSLPQIMNSVIFDGYTQPGASPNTLSQGNNAALKVVLDGSAAGQGANGLDITAGNCTVTGLDIIQFRGNGVFLEATSNGDKVAGNFIGTDPTGMLLADNQTGVGIHSSDNTIGGTAPAARNVISGNSGNGIGIFGGFGGGANVIAGNYIGTDANGIHGIRNDVGIMINGGSANNTIGGAAAGAGNIIQSSNNYGVVIGGGETGTVVEGNTIFSNNAGGVLFNNFDAGNTLIGNAIVDNVGNGVTFVASPEPSTMVGGTAAGAGNVISGNSGDGVFVGNGDTGISVLGNSIFANGGLGIHLDSTTGANDNQAAPVLTGVSGSAASPMVSGTLNSVASTTFRIEFFANPSPSNLANTEGQTLLGSMYVTTDASGHASFTSPGLSPIPASEGYLTATATVATPSGNGTYTYGDSSQFSAYRPVSYIFSGFLPPLGTGLQFGLNRTIPIKFTLTDLSGNAVTSLSAVTALQVFNSQGVDVLGGTGAAGLNVSGGQYSYSWHTKGLAAGSYTITVTLADGSTDSKTITLTANGNGNSGLVADGSSGSSTGSTAGGLLGGDLALYVDNSAGNLTADELAAIDAGVGVVDGTVNPYGVNVTETTDPTAADVVVTVADSTALGGAADGVLGCESDGLITLVSGWSWYAGTDPTQITAGQYDFETVFIHELGHALGLGHSTDTTSVMYPTLAAGTTDRALTAADLNVADTASGACGLHAAAPAGGTAETGPALPAPVQVSAVAVGTPGRSTGAALTAAVAVPASAAPTVVPVAVTMPEVAGLLGVSASPVSVPLPASASPAAVVLAGPSASAPGQSAFSWRGDTADEGVDDGSLLPTVPAPAGECVPDATAADGDDALASSPQADDAGGWFSVLEDDGGAQGWGLLPDFDPSAQAEAADPEALRAAQAAVFAEL